MSVLDNILAGIAGGLRGGVQGYELGQDMLDRKTQRANQTSEIKLRQQEHDDLEQQRADLEKDRAAATSDRAAAAKAAADEKQREARRKFIELLPDGPAKAHMLALYGADLYPDVAFSDGSDGSGGQGAVSPMLPGAPLPLEASPDGTPAPVASQVPSRPRVVIGAGESPHADIEPLLPSWAQGAYHASGHNPKYVPNPEQWNAPPQTPQDKERQALDLFRKQEAIRHSYDKTPAEGKAAPTDDPSLPAGAKTYIAGLATKYGGNYKAANDEFTRALPSMLQTHPRMDVKKARAAFDAMFSADARPKSGNILDILSGLNGGAEPEESGAPAQPPASSTPPAALPQPAVAPSQPAPLPQPAARPAANPALATLTTQATTLLQQYTVERNPQRKAALAAQLAQLRQQLQAARGMR